MKRIHLFARASAFATFAGIILGGVLFSPADGAEISNRCGTFIMPNDIAAFAARAISSHRALLAGAKTAGQLSSEETTELNVLVENYSTCAHRPKPVSADPKCRSARDIADRAVRSAIRDADSLSACLRRSDLADDCSSRFRAVKDSKHPFEDAVAQVTSTCR
jgi:hypothetical protein